MKRLPLVFVICIATSTFAQNIADTAMNPRVYTYGSIKEFQQDNPCAAVLKDGIRDRYESRTQIHKYRSLKEYFRSADFETDVQKGGWDAGVTIPIQGVPIGVNAGSSHDDFSHFSHEIEKLTEEEVDESFAYYLKKSNINVRFVQAYFDCLAKHLPGFSSTSDLVGSRVHFLIRFQPLSVTHMPKLKEDGKIFNAKEPLGLPRKGDTLDLLTLITAAPNDPKSAVTVELRTSEGPVYCGSDVVEVKQPECTVECRIYRLSGDPEHKIPMAHAADIHVCRVMTEEQARKDNINYSFQILCYDNQKQLIGASGQNDDRMWPAGCCSTK